MRKFLKNCWEVLAFGLVLLTLRFFVFAPIVVDGHSMEPTLQDGERMVMVKIANINRLDIVVASEPDEPSKKIIKRVIGMPNDTIKFDHDNLFINGKEMAEPYLDTYKKLWKKGKLQKEYSFDPYFQKVAREAKAFTTSFDGNPVFEFKVPKGHYFLIGDDRLVSKDSRYSSVGTIGRNEIIGEVKFSFWPLNGMKFVK